MSQIATAPEVPKSSLPAELHESLELFKRHGVPVMIGVAVALAIVLGIGYYRSRTMSAQRDALMLLSSARSYDELERVVSDYSTTPAAPLALLKIAHAYYASGNYALAKDKYDAFTAKYAQHALAPVAELGVLHCVEAQGHVEEALAGFQGFTARHPDHFLVAQATLGEARCLEQLGRLTQARVVYEQFLAAHPDSAWGRQIEDLLATVKDDIAKGREGKVRTAPPALTGGGSFAPLALPTTPATTPESAAATKPQD